MFFIIESLKIFVKLTVGVFYIYLGINKIIKYNKEIDETNEIDITIAKCICDMLPFYTTVIVGASIIIAQWQNFQNLTNILLN